MTTLHYEMLKLLGELSKKIVDNPEKKGVLCLEKTGAKIIDSVLEEIKNNEDFSIIESKINKTSLMKDYKKALIASFRKIYDNESFDGDMIFNVFNT